MNDAYGIVDGMRQGRHDIRQPMAGVLALVGAAQPDAGRTGVPGRQPPSARSAHLCPPGPRPPGAGSHNPGYRLHALLSRML